MPERVPEEVAIVSTAGEPHGTTMGIPPLSIAFPEPFCFSFLKA